MFFIVSLYFFFIIWILSSINKIDSHINNEELITHNVSVVVAVRNEEDSIKTLLDALIKQNYNKSNYEIIVSNDHSSDKTLNILNEYLDKIKNLKIINITDTPSKWDSKMWALNEAIKDARGEIILHIDGDCVPGINWIKNMSNQFINKSVGVVLSFTPLKGFGLFGKIIEHESLAQDALTGLALTKHLFLSCNGRSLGYRKKYFFDINGFDEINFIRGGDDDLLIHKIIYYKKCIAKYIINKNSSVCSSASKSLKEFVLQRLRYASKGIQFYKLKFVSIELKLLMPFLYITNLLTCFCVIKYCWDPNIKLATFILIKILGDWIFINMFAYKINYKINYIILLLLSVLHPFYIIIFSTIAPFIKVSWKDETL